MELNLADPIITACGDLQRGKTVIICYNGVIVVILYYGV